MILNTLPLYINPPLSNPNPVQTRQYLKNGETIFATTAAVPGTAYATFQTFILYIPIYYSYFISWILQVRGSHRSVSSSTHLTPSVRFSSPRSIVPCSQRCSHIPHPDPQSSAALITEISQDMSLGVQLLDQCLGVHILLFKHHILLFEHLLPDRH